jgi:integrase
MDLSKNQTLLVETNTSLQRMQERMVVREEKSTETFRRYLDGIRNLQIHMKADSPDALLSVLTESKDLTAVLDSWVAGLQKTGKRPNNIKSMIMGVKKFLFSNRVNGVEWSFIGRPKVSVQLRDRIPSADELRLILSNNTTLRDKALFMTAACSGLRIGTLASLKAGDLTAYETTAFITVTGGKGRKLANGKEYQTWVTPETYTAIQEYFKLRDNLEPTAPLFAKISKGQEGVSIYPQNVARQWIVLIERARLLKRIENHRMFDLHVHTLRKYFQTKCKLAGCKTSFVDLWLGHVVGEYLNGSYFRPDIRESFNEYKKAIPALTIFSKAEEIKIELAELKEKVAELQTFYEIIRDVIPENLLVRLQLEKLHREYSGASEAPISLKKNDEKR